MSKQQTTEARPSRWTPALRRQVAVLERRLAEPEPEIKGHSKAAEKRRQAICAERRELRAQLEKLIPCAPFKVADNGIHEYVETKEFVLFRNHGESFWRGVLKTAGGGFNFVANCGSRLPKIALGQLRNAMEARA